MYETGYTKPMMYLTVKDKANISSVLTTYHLMTKVKAAMDQFIEGLNSLNVLHHIQENSSRWREYFVDTGIIVDAGKL